MSSTALPTSRRFVTQLLNSLLSTHTIATDSNPLCDAPETTKKQLLALQILFPNEFLPALDLLDRRLVTRLRVGDGEENNATETDTNVGPADQEEDDVQAKDNGALPTGDEDIDNAGGHGTTIPTDEHQQPYSKEATGRIAPSSTADHVMTDAPTHVADTPLYSTAQTGQNTIYYVRSAQQRSSRYSTSYDTATSYEVRLLAWNCSCPAFAFAAFPAVHQEPAIPTYDAHGRLERDGLTIDQALGLEEDGEWSFGGVSLGDSVPPVCKHLLACVLAEKCRGLFGEFVEERIVSVAEAAGWAAGWGD